MKALNQLITIKNDSILKIKQELGEVPKERPDKLDYIAHMKGFIEEQESALAKELKALQMQKKQFEAALETLELLVKQEFVDEGLQSDEGRNFKFNVSESQGALIVENEKMIPSEFFEEKVVRTLNKEKLKAAITMGMFIDGASIKKGHRLTIKAKE